MRSVFDYEEISDKKAKLISKLVLLSNNTQVLSLKMYTYSFVLSVLLFESEINKTRMFKIGVLFWFLCCVAYNLMDIKIDLIVERIEDYASTEPNEDMDLFHYFMEIENTERNISILMNVVMSILHIYFIYNTNFRIAAVCLIVRLMLKEIIKAIELRYK